MLHVFNSTKDLIQNIVIGTTLTVTWIYNSLFSMETANITYKWTMVLINVAGIILIIYKIMDYRDKRIARKIDAKIEQLGDTNVSDRN